MDQYTEAQSRMLRQELTTLDDLEEVRPTRLPVGVALGEEFI